MVFRGKSLFSCVLAALAAAWLVAAGAVAHADDGAVAFLDGLRQEVVATVAAPGLADSERQRNFRTLMQRAFSLDDICQQVLGRYGRSASDEERREFRRLFEDMLVLTWTGRFREYTGQGVRFGTVTPTANGDVAVLSEVEGTDRRPVVVEWRLRGDVGSYRLIDIKAEGASMLLTYRSEYQAVLRNGGIGELNGLLRKKVGELAGAG